MDNLFSDPAFRKILFPDLISRDHLTLRMEINGFLMLVVFKDLALKTARQKIRPFQIADDPVIPSSQTVLFSLLARIIIQRTVTSPLEG